MTSHLSSIQALEDANWMQALASANWTVQQHPPRPPFAQRFLSILGAPIRVVPKKSLDAALRVAHEYECKRMKKQLREEETRLAKITEEKNDLEAKEALYSKNIARYLSNSDTLNQVLDLFQDIPEIHKDQLSIDQLPDLMKQVSALQQTARLQLAQCVPQTDKEYRELLNCPYSNKPLDDAVMVTTAFGVDIVSASYLQSPHPAKISSEAQFLLQQALAIRPDYTVRQLAVSQTLKEELIDPVLMERFENPQTLGCGHTFSTETIEKVIKSSKPHCPVCRSEFQLTTSSPNWLVVASVTYLAPKPSGAAREVLKSRLAFFDQKQQLLRAKCLELSLQLQIPLCTLFCIQEQISQERKALEDLRKELQSLPLNLQWQTIATLSEKLEAIQKNPDVYMSQLEAEYTRGEPSSVKLVIGLFKVIEVRDKMNAIIASCEPMGSSTLPPVHRSFLENKVRAGLQDCTDKLFEKCLLSKR